MTREVDSLREAVARALPCLTGNCGHKRNSICNQVIAGEVRALYCRAQEHEATGLDEHREPTWVTLNPDGSVFRWNDGTPVLHHSIEEAGRYLSPGGRVAHGEVFISFAEAVR